MDTNVIFQGLTQQGGAAGLIIDACLADLIQACVSNTLSYEYVDVLSRKLSETRWLKIQPVLGLLLSQAEYIPIYYSWRPNITYLLLQQLDSNDNVEKVSESAIAQQQKFTKLLETLGKISQEEAEIILKQRERVEPDDGLTPETIARFQQQIQECKKH